MTESPVAGPSPRLRSRQQLAPHRIPLHVPQHLVQILVGFHRKRLEAALVQEAGSRSVIVRVPMLGMRHRQPAKEFRLRHLPISARLRPHHPVPVRRLPVKRNAHVPFRLRRELIRRVSRRRRSPPAASVPGSQPWGTSMATAGRIWRCPAATGRFPCS